MSQGSSKGLPPGSSDQSTAGTVSRATAGSTARPSSGSSAEATVEVIVESTVDSKPRVGLTPVDEALRAILSGAQLRVATEQVPLLDALGRVLATDQIATVDVPPLDNSAMDGYCFAYNDLSAGTALPISQRIAAGELGTPLAAATAARIFTGAPLPANADSIVMQENVELIDGAIVLLAAVKKGQHVRPAGQDITKGSCVLARGKRLSPPEIGLLASIGVEQVTVYQPLRVAVMSTGDELREPGQALGPGQIYNSNRYTLTTLLRAMGCDVVDGGIVADSFDNTCAALTELASRADLIISSGGVSVGEEDHVKAAVQSLGRLDVWKLSIKPGKPLAFGAVGQTPFFGLPGNPSSVLVTFSICARPYIQLCQGLSAIAPLLCRVRADFELPTAGTRQEYLRVRVVAGVAELHHNQSSGVLASASWANALAVIPIGATVAKGDDIEVHLLSELMG